jgi:hypothetical protein
VLLATTATSTLLSGALTAQALAGSRLIWPLYLLVACKSASDALGGPARRAILAGLVGADHLAASLALNRATFQVTAVAGSALGGLLASLPPLGLSGCYLVDAASFLASFWGVAGLPDLGGAPGGPAPVASSRVFACSTGPLF